MDINELYYLSDWFLKLSNNEGRLIELYSNLYNKLYSNSVSASKSPLEAEREELFSKLRSVDISTLSIKQKNVMEKYGVLQYITADTVNYLEDIFLYQDFDVATVADKINQIVQTMNTTSSKLNTIKNSLADLVDEKQITTKSEYSMRVHFQSDASIKNLTDLKTWSKHWYDIGNGISNITGDRTESFKIISTENGSIVLVFSVNLNILKVMSYIISSLHDITIQLLETKNVIAEVTEKKLGDNVIEELKKNYQEKLDTTPNEVINTLVIEGLVDDSNNELVEKIKKSLKSLMHFIEKGGEVDITVPDNEDDEKDESGQRLLEVKEHIKQLKFKENHIKMLVSNKI